MVPRHIFQSMIASNRPANARPFAWLFSSFGLIGSFLLALHLASAFANYESLGPSSRRTSLVISEIMYHPTNRADGRNLEFIELHNAGELPERVDGYRLSGDVEFTFPSNLVMRAGAVLVVAAVPADVQAVYGITNVIGGFTNTPGVTTNALPNGAGTVRLRNAMGAVLLEVNYSDDAPWPLAADGAGHSLVLARPSYGERDARAWAASAAKGGSPGTADAVPSGPLETIFINEIFTRTNDPSGRFIELYNHSATAVDLGGCWLSDDPATNKFRIGDGINISPQGFVTFNETALGFPLDAAGGTLFLVSPNGARVLDVVKFGGQAADASFGRFPDGTPTLHELRERTPGAANAALLVRDVVINEVMYRPPSGDGDDEFIELFNRGTNAVDLGGWRLSGGVGFTFPSNTVLTPGGYLAVAENAAHLRTNYANLDTTNLIGNFSGNLAADGERLTLSRPEWLIRTNLTTGTIATNQIRVVVAEIRYHDGGRWGKWAHGGGSSLELIDSRGDSRLGPNWADSDESGKSAWTTVEATGALIYGDGEVADSLEIILLDTGECLIDDVEVFQPGGANLVTNPGFTSGTSGWAMEGTHDLSSWQSTGGTGNSGCLRLRATDRGEYLANRVRVGLTTGLASGATATLRAKARWLRGSPELLLRLKGNYLEAYGRLPLPANLGTPGARNSAAVTNFGPVILDVTHSPILPAPNQVVVVSARLYDPDGITNAVLRYRVDPSTALTSVPMNDAGTNGDAVAADGIYSAPMPGRAQGTIVAFRVIAADGLGAVNQYPNLGKVYPGDTLLPECLVRFGETQPARGPSRFSTYHVWAVQATLSQWASRSPAHNSPLDATFVYNNERVIYDTGAHYAGSALSLQAIIGASPQTPTRIGYVFTLPDDRPFLGAASVTMDFNTRDVNAWGGHSEHEQAVYWFAEQLGLQFNHRRYVNFYFNGINNSTVFEDVQQPNGDILDQWYPSDNEGGLYKMEVWWPNSNLGGIVSHYNWHLPLANYTRGSMKNLATYRWAMLKRAVKGPANDYDDLFALVDALNAPAATYAANLDATIDLEQWARALAVRHAAGDLDTFSVRASHNMYFYKPRRGRWQLLNFDHDLAFFETPSVDLFWVEYDTQAQRLFQHPPFVRAYLRALQDLVNGPMAQANWYSFLDSHYWLLSVTNGLGALEVSPNTSPDPTVPGSTWSRKSYIDLRRNTIVNNYLNPVANTPFTVTSPASNSAFAQNFITLSGTAPIGMRSITVNGVEHPVTWTSTTNWTLQVALPSGTNGLVIGGLDRLGNPMPTASVNLTLRVTGTTDLPEQSLVINEILYRPPNPEAEFVEVFNRSATTAFDLGGWRLNGVDFTFEPGTVIAPGGYLVVVKDRTAFGLTYGVNIPIAGQYDGSLDNGGETLSLVQPGLPFDRVINGVAFDDDAPWPPIADASGASLQLIDPMQDNRRVLNWAAAQTSPMATPGAQNSVRASLPPFSLIWLNEIQPDNFHSATDDMGHAEPWVELFNEGSTPISLDGFYLTADFTNLTQWAFPANSSIGATNYLVVWLDGATNESTPTELHANFSIPRDMGTVALVKSIGGEPAVLDYVRYEAVPTDNSFGDFPDGNPLHRRLFIQATPGGTNNASTAPYTIYINEWMADNESTLADPADGDYEDWFELYNPNRVAVNLSGYYLSDSFTNLTGRWRVPARTIIAPRGFLLVWADEEPEQNGPSSTALHAGFKLNKAGESIAVFGPDGQLLDAVTFGRQFADTSEGRWPNGAPEPFYPNSTPTPGAPNMIDPTNQPIVTIVSAIRGPAGELTLGWTSLPGRAYRVLFKEQLSDPAWRAIEGDVVANSMMCTKTVAVPAGDGQRFLRVQLLED